MSSNFNNYEAMNISCLQQSQPDRAHLHDLLSDAFELSADLTHWQCNIHVLSYVADTDLGVAHRALE